MTDYPKEQQLIIKAFEDFYSLLDSKSVVVLRDILVHLDLTHGEVTISTHDDTVSVATTIYSWIAKDLDAAPVRVAEPLPILTSVLQTLQAQEYFERACFQPPIVVRYSDSTGAKPQVILEIASDWSVTDTPLLPDSEKELQAFLTRLLAED